MLIVKSKKEILWSFICAFLGVAVGAAIHFSPIMDTLSKNTDEDLIVVVDAGHGLPDGGAVGVNGTVEQGVNLDIAFKLCEVLQGKGIKVVMTRVDEHCLSKEEEGKSIRQMKKEDMHKRLDIIKKSKGDIFVSIHMNYFTNSKVDGLRLFYDRKHEETKILAENIQQKMSKVTGAQMHTVKAADQNLFLMKNPPVPAVLVECGFLSNAEEEKKLNDEDYRSRIAWAIADAIEKYYEEI
ncbi:MAG: N-acetylmuramoyl-L-alanine amidase [Clostridia bacterium]|nr:N-acetylmuramoyl-L-alanine amidase [Clostridia bacterium]